MFPFSLMTVLLALAALNGAFIIAWLLRWRRRKIARRDLHGLLAQAEMPLTRGLRHDEIVRLARRRLPRRRGEAVEDGLQDLAFDLSLDDLARGRDYDDEEKLAAALRGEHPSRQRYYHLTERGLKQAPRLEAEA